MQMTQCYDCNAIGLEDNCMNAQTEVYSIQSQNSSHNSVTILVDKVTAAVVASHYLVNT